MSDALCRIYSAEVEFRRHDFVEPLQVGWGAMDSATEAVATVAVEVGHGERRALGRGSVSLNHLWAWPESKRSPAETESVLRRMCAQMAAHLPSMFGASLLHPTEAGLQLHAWACRELQADEDPPPLARVMCASPFDAAIHDAVGRALDVSSFRLYDDPAPLPSADDFFSPRSAARAIREVLHSPRDRLPAWRIVGRGDILAGAFADAVSRHGYECFKLDVRGLDVRADVARTAKVYRAARELQIESPRLSVDGNEEMADAEGVLEYLHRLRADDPRAYAALQYLKQPTDRNIAQFAFDWRDVAALKPVFLDDGLSDLNILPLAKEQGWSGVSLKTCQGHSMLLVAAAWAHRNGLALAMHDLTNSGVALIHAALTAAHLPTINGVELTSPQFTPAANRGFLPRLSGLFDPREGRHLLPKETPVGLGSHL